MNNITFDGRLAADPELRYTPSGEPVLSFRVGSDIGFGERKTTNWFSCQVWGKRGESLKNILSKGQQVTVYGQLTLREWQNKEGHKQLSPDVRVNELSLHGGKRDGASSMGDHDDYGEPGASSAAQHRQEGKQSPKSDSIDDDLPF